MTITLPYCITHGHHHRDGEADHVDTLGDDVYCINRPVEVVEGEVVSSRNDPLPMPAAPFFVIRSGDLAYLETFGAGLIPIKVLSIDAEKVLFKTTAERPGWPRNRHREVSTNNMLLIHRGQVSFVGGKYRVTGQRRLMTDEGVLL